MSTTPTPEGLSDEQILSCMGDKQPTRTSARHGAAIFEYRLFDLIDFARSVLALSTSARDQEGVQQDRFAGEIAYQLTKRLVIDMPTARAAVDDALKNEAPAQLRNKTAESNETAALIIRDVCEMEPADPDLPDTIYIDISDLLRIVKRHTGSEE